MVLVGGLAIVRPSDRTGALPVSIGHKQKVFFCSLNPGVLGRMSTPSPPQDLNLAKPVGKNLQGLGSI